MALIATEGDRFSNVVPWLAFPAERFHFDVVTVNVATAGTLAFGTVLAKVTSTGKYIVQDSSLASGFRRDSSLSIAASLSSSMPQLLQGFAGHCIAL